MVCMSHTIPKVDFVLNGLQSRTGGGSAIYWNLHSLSIITSIIAFLFSVATTYLAQG